MDDHDELFGEYLVRIAGGDGPDLEALRATHPTLARDLEGYLEDCGAISTLLGELGETARHDQNARIRLGQGEVVGGNTILRFLGRGGMGEVYLARQTTTDRLIALKVLRQGRRTSRRGRDRFLHELRSLAQLRHPRIVHLLEAGRHGDLTYFSMEYVEGTDLARGMAREALKPRAAAALMSEVAEAIAYSHERGILHCDLKPANILLDLQGRPHVADFGLARPAAHPGPGSPDDPADERLGSPSYMAPEQCDASSAGPTTRTDVYGLGAILYELLSGAPPFRGPDPLATVRQVLHDPLPPPSRRRAGVPRDLEAVCLKCLRKEPQERYATAAEVADELARYLDDQPVNARRPGPIERIGRGIRRSPGLAASLVATVLALASLCALSLAYGVASARQQARLARALESRQQRDVELALVRGDWDDALETSAQALRGGARDPSWFHLARLQAFAANQRGDRALVELRDAQRYPEASRHAGAIAIWGAELGHLHDPDAFREAIESASKFPLRPAERAYVGSLTAEGTAQALDALDRGLRASPLDQRLLAQSALLLILSGRHDRAVEPIRLGLSAFPRDPRFAFLASLAAIFEGDPEGRGIHGRLLAPDTTASLDALAESIDLLRKVLPRIDEPGSYEADVRRLLARHPRPPHAGLLDDLGFHVPAGLRRVLDGFGTLAVASGQDAQLDAAESLAALIDIHPEATLALGAGLMFIRVGRWDRAEALLTRAVDLPGALPEAPRDAAYWGMMCALRRDLQQPGADHLPRAVALARRRLALGPLESRPAAFVAYALDRGGDPRLALEVAEAQLRRAPDDPDWTRRAAEKALKADLPGTAFDHARRFLGRFPDHPGIRTLQDRARAALTPE